MVEYNNQEEAINHLNVELLNTLEEITNEEYLIIQEEYKKASKTGDIKNN